MDRLADPITGRPGEPADVAEPVDAVEREEPARGDYPQPAAPPAFTPMPGPRAAAYMIASLLLTTTQGVGMNMVAANIPQLQGAIGATTTEATWLIAVYMAPNVSLSLALIKIRTQYGLRNFAELSILGFLLAMLLNLFITDLHSALVVRFMSGIAAAPLSALGFLYMLEPFPPERKLTIGLPLALTGISLGAPLTRVISPELLDISQWHGLSLMETGLACMAFGAVYWLPLAPQPRMKVIEWPDIVSYLLIAVGFGATAVVLVLGRIYWWFEAPWLGVTLALAVLCVTCAAIIELNRANPLLDIRWLTSPPVLHFAGALLLFRIILSEQTTGAAGFFQAMGFSPGQLQVLFGVILAATVAGGLTCAAVLKPGREPQIHVVALALLIAGALMDAHATAMTAPAQMFLSQALIAFAGGLFLPPALLSGLMSALKKGPNYILSFVIVFLTTQSIGGLLGAAVLGTFVTRRQAFHGTVLAEGLTASDPMVSERIGLLGGAFRAQTADSGAASAQGLSTLAGEVSRQATVLAYNDAFLLIALLAGGALAGLLIHMTIDAIRAVATARAAHA